MEENYYKVVFKNSSGFQIFCKVSADRSIKDMIQTFNNKASIDLKDYAFIFNAKNIDINSEKKIKELFNNDTTNLKYIIFFEIRPSLKITFNSSGSNTIVKYYGCLCCSPFWFLLKVYLDEIGLDENCLKDLTFIFNGNTLPNDKIEAMKNSSTKYGIQDGSTIKVIDTKNLLR